MTTPVLATTLDDLLDTLWDMHPRSRTIWEDRSRRIAIHWRGIYKWYAWSVQADGYVWIDSTRTLGRFITRWKRI